MAFPRESGVLLHPTSLPGPFGIGDFGDGAFRFIDWLARAGQRLWQVMPLGPTGYGDSPYASPSAFAGNPLLVSLEWLKGDGLLVDGDLANAPEFPESHVDFGPVVTWRSERLGRAHRNSLNHAGSHLRNEYEAFCESQAWWLDDYALFMAIRQENDMRDWQSWPADVRLREPSALESARTALAQEVDFNRFVQFHFNRQWMSVRGYANERGIRIIGDIPIFVAADSADAWANQVQFRLDDNGHADVVAGVPPDPFSETGQIWGNPVYDWRQMASDGYAWWRRRIRRTIDTVDVVRIDHFRGFAASWVVPSPDGSCSLPPTRASRVGRRMPRRSR